MKFLAHGDSVVSLRFLYEVGGGSEALQNTEIIPEADSFEGLMLQVETGLDLVRSGEMTSAQAADAQIALFSLSTDYAHEPRTEDQQFMIDDLETAAMGILNPSEVLVNDPELSNPELDAMSTQALSALNRILTIEPGEDPSNIDAGDLKIVEDFAEALEAQATSPEMKDAYAQAMSDAITERFPSFIGRTAFLSQPRNLRSVVADMLSELSELKVSEVDALKPQVNLDLAELSGDITQQAIKVDANRPAGEVIAAGAIVDQVKNLPDRVSEMMLASFTEDTAQQLGMNITSMEASMEAMAAMEA